LGLNPSGRRGLRAGGVGLGFSGRTPSITGLGRDGVLGGDLGRSL